MAVRGCAVGDKLVDESACQDKTTTEREIMAKGSRWMRAAYVNGRSLRRPGHVHKVTLLFSGPVVVITLTTSLTRSHARFACIARVAQYILFSCIVSRYLSYDPPITPSHIHVC